MYIIDPTSNVFFYNNAGAIARINGAFGHGTGPIILDDTRCEGFETSLVSCLHGGIEAHNCDHSKDAGVVCRPGKFCVWLVSYASA